MASWNAWHWRWNPHLLAARGYAVLLPDPAISTGYGQAFIDRGWGRWGEEPYTDLLAAIDGALERPDLDRVRTAAMGGSFGGYMANWVAGHTDRFRAIVTHASLWELRGFHGTTDHGPSWEAEFGDPYLDPSRYEASSPHRFLDRIRTPMLVIHGELDHRVPISEALRLWTDLQRHGVPSRFLYFPDENHWVLQPRNARLWYETVLAFLDEQVLGLQLRMVQLLGQRDGFRDGFLGFFGVLVDVHRLLSAGLKACTTEHARLKACTTEHVPPEGLHYRSRVARRPALQSSVA